MASAWLLKGHSADDGVALPVSPRQLVPGFRLELCDVLRTQHHVEVEVIERRRRRQIRLGGRHAVREHPASAGWQITLKAGAAAAPSTPASEKRGFSGI